MSTNLEAKDVTLSVEFAGVCLYVVDRRQQPSVSVLMPTCVPTPDGRVNTRHEDGDVGARHVPYLLMDLANLDQSVTAGLVADGPRFQVVRRLRREELVFEPVESGDIELDSAGLPLPDLSVHKDVIRLKNGVLSASPPVELDVRTTLNGGKLTATTVGGPGKDNGGHGRKWDEPELDWAGSIRWTRTIPGGSARIRIRSWDTGQENLLTLRPVARGDTQVIDLKIAILCETNPLEWREFEPVFEKEDVDFKWLFRLFEANVGNSVLGALKRAKLPYPKLRPRRARTTGNAGCTGGQFGLP